jgi:hypothetical protein
MTELLAGLIGAFVGAMSNVFVEIFRRTCDGRALASMLAAEISSLLEISELRSYNAGAEMVLAKLQAGEDVQVPNFIGDIDRWIRTYLENMERVGLLGPELAGEVTLFYQLIRSVAMDVSRLASEPFDGATKVRFVSETIQVFQSAQEVGARAVHGLKAFAANGVGWHVLRHL